MSGRAIIGMTGILLYTIACDAQSNPFKDSTFVKQLPEKVNLNALPANYYAQHLGFFCKEEIKLDKRTIVPLRFRLGGMDYCNFLEQKPGYKKKQN